MDAKAMWAILTQSKDHASIAANDYNRPNTSNEMYDHIAKRTTEHNSRAIASASLIFLSKPAPPFTHTCELMNRSKNICREAFADNNLQTAQDVCKLYIENYLRVGSLARCGLPNIESVRLYAYLILALPFYHMLFRHLQAHHKQAQVVVNA